jgi:hypothetical protein
MESMEGSQRVCAEEVTLLRLKDIQNSLVYGIEFGCKHAIKTVELTGKHRAFVDEGTTI